MKDYFVTIRTETDIYIALHYTRLILNQLSFSDMDKQKVIVTVSELTRNILDHANAKGSFTAELIEDRGIKITVQDQGRGMDHADKPINCKEMSNRRGLGLGLAGAQRMMDEFTIQSSEGGTTIVCTKWKGIQK